MRSSPEPRELLPRLPCMWGMRRTLRAAISNFHVGLNAAITSAKACLAPRWPSRGSSNGSLRGKSVLHREGKCRHCLSPVGASFVSINVTAFTPGYTSFQMCLGRLAQCERLELAFGPVVLVGTCQLGQQSGPLQLVVVPNQQPAPAAHGSEGASTGGRQPCKAERDALGLYQGPDLVRSGRRKKRLDRALALAPLLQHRGGTNGIPSAYCGR
jgi:hypothetical protein